MESRPESLSVNPGELWMSGSLQGNEESPAASELNALIARAVTGDRAAFGEIIGRYERRVVTLSWRLLGTVEDAEDAAQEVFLRAFKYLHRFDTTKPIEPWLVRMTVNVCRVAGRKRHQRRSFLCADTKAPDPAAPGDPHADFDAAEQRRILQNVLSGLPEKERTAVILRDIEGMSTAEVAAILGSSEATVRSQISSARLKIRKQVQRMKGGLR